MKLKNNEVLVDCPVLFHFKYNQLKLHLHFAEKLNKLVCFSITVEKCVKRKIQKQIVKFIIKWIRKQKAFYHKAGEIDYTKANMQMTH